jgi:hypothetical protein
MFGNVHPCRGGARLESKKAVRPRGFETQEALTMTRFRRIAAACACALGGCSTASLQSTEMAERIYAEVGFRDLGRILEYVR